MTTTTATSETPTTPVTTVTTGAEPTPAASPRPAGTRTFSAAAPTSAAPARAQLPRGRHDSTGLGEALAAMRPSGRTLAGLAIAGGMTALSAVMGSRNNPSLKQHPKTWLWWKLQDKPAYTPPGWVFGTAWPALWTLSAASFLKVWQLPDGKERSEALALWGAQAVTNALWTKLFFGEHKREAALADILLHLGATGAYTVKAGRLDPVAGALAAPLTAWLSFATLLNAEAVRRN